MSYVGEISQSGEIVDTIRSSASSVDDAIEGIAWHYASISDTNDPVSGEIFLYADGGDKSDGIKARFQEIPKDAFQDGRMEIEHID